MILCPICHAQLKTRRGFSIHLTRNHDSMTNLDRETLLVYTIFGKDMVETIKDEYINEKWCIYDLPIDIAKFITLSGLKRNSKQERSTLRYKNKYKKSIIAKYGVDNISKVPAVQRKKEDTYKKKFGGYDEYLKIQRSYMKRGYDNYIGTDKHKEACSKAKSTCFERYGHENFGKGKDALEKSKNTRRETILGWDYDERLSRTSAARAAVNHRGGYSSSIEKRVRKSLVDLDVNFISNKHLWNYNWDMVICDYNIIIEVQGIMWHAKPSIYKENDLIMGKILARSIWDKDKRKRTKALLEGYNVIEIWEDDINKKNDEELTILVKEKLEEYGYKF